MKMTAAVTKLARYTMLAAPLALAPAVSSVMMKSAGLDGLQVGVAFAQSEKAEEKPKYKTRKTPALRETVYKKLAVVQKLTNPEKPEDKPDFKQALVELKNIEKNSSKFNQYELAQMYNYFGFVYYTLENFKEAIKYYNLVIAQSPNIPEGLELGTLYTVAQLYFVLEDFSKAIVALDKWMAASPIVGADAHVLKSQGHYQLNEMSKSLASINTAVDMYEKKGKIPKENWFSLQRALYYDKGDNKKVIQILEKMVRHYPKVTYYKQLSGLYGTVNRERDQLHMLEAAYLMGGLTKEKEVLNLAYLFMGEDAPYKAAKVIDKGMKDKIIEQTSENLELLASAWRMAQEIKKSIPEMVKAAEKSKKGDLYARLAGVYLDNDQNKKALDVGLLALKRGGIKRVDQLHIVMGMARTNLGKYGDAIKSFKEAAKDKRSSKFANQWIQFCESEIKRRQQLNV